MVDTVCQKFDLYGALWMLCSRWHSGQWSRGYRILSRLSKKHYRPGHGICNGRFETEEQREYYRRYYRLRHTL